MIEVLETLRKSLNFFTYEKDEQILAVAIDNMSAPFIYVICDNEYPETLLVSIAVDYPISTHVAEVILACTDLSHTELTEGFYISQLNGETVFGGDAENRFDLENLDLKDIHPLNDLKN